jgi:hypothetical protein
LKLYKERLLRILLQRRLRRSSSFSKLRDRDKQPL